MLHSTKPRIERFRLRAAAAGISSSASTSTAPMIFTQATVSMVISSTNTYSSRCTRTPRTWARLGFRLASSIWLNSGSAVTAVSTVVMSSTLMSVSLTVRIEPNITVSRMCVLTLADTHSSAVAPMASEIDRNTPISVSDDIFVRFRVKFSNRPNSRQKLNIDTIRRGVRLADDHADRDAGQRGIADGLREERHALGHHHRADAAEQRTDDQRAQEAVDDEGVGEGVVDRAGVREIDDELARNLVQRGHDDTASRTGRAKRREQMGGGAARQHLARRSVEQHLAVDVGHAHRRSR